MRARVHRGGGRRSLLRAMAAEDFDLSFDDAFAGDSGPADAPAEEASPRSPPLSAAPERLTAYSKVCV